MQHDRSILPTFDVFDLPASPAAPVAQDGLGRSRLFALSPVIAAVKGLGADAAPTDPSAPADQKVTGGDWVAMLAVLGVAAAASYQAGKAIAPSRSVESKWGMIAVPVGMFTGVLGLGVMGFMANRRKG